MSGLETCEWRRVRPPQIVVGQSNLRLVGTSKGSVTTEWELTPPAEFQPHLSRSGERAVQMLFRSNDGESGLSNEVREAVNAELDEIGKDLSGDVEVVMLTSRVNAESLEFRRVERGTFSGAKRKSQARINGMLLEVDWARCTAQLHPNGARYVRLTFDQSLGDEMLRLATQHVEVSGVGELNRLGGWNSIAVDNISRANSSSEPFDLNVVLEDPHPKIFKRDKIVAASEPFDVEQFNRIIRRGRKDS